MKIFCWERGSRIVCLSYQVLDILDLFNPYKIGITTILFYKQQSWMFRDVLSFMTIRRKARIPSQAYCNVMEPEEFQKCPPTSP